MSGIRTRMVRLDQAPNTAGERAEALEPSDGQQQTGTVEGTSMRFEAADQAVSETPGRTRKESPK